MYHSRTVSFHCRSVGNVKAFMIIGLDCKIPVKAASSPKNYELCLHTVRKLWTCITRCAHWPF